MCRLFLCAAQTGVRARQRPPHNGERGETTAPHFSDAPQLSHPTRERQTKKPQGATSAPRPPNETSRVSQKSGGLFAISSLLFAKSRLLLTAPCGENPTGFDARGAMWAMSPMMQTWLSLLLAAGMFKLHFVRRHARTAWRKRSLHRRFLAAGMFKLHFVRLHASHGLAKTLVAQTFSRRGYVQTSLRSFACLAQLGENARCTDVFSPRAWANVTSFVCMPRTA